MERQSSTHLNPVPSPAIQPPAQPQPQRAQRRRRKPCHALNPSKTRKRDAIATSWLTSYTDIPGFCQDATCLIEECIHQECIHQHIKTSVTNFRKPLEVRLTVAITLRHLATRETYTSLQYHWLVAHTTICKFAPRSAKPSLLNSRMNIYTALIALLNGKGRRRSAEIDRMSPCWRCHRWEEYCHEEAKENRQ